MIIFFCSFKVFVCTQLDIKVHQQGLPGGSPRIPLPASARREELVDAERHSAPWWCAESHPSDLCGNNSTFPQPVEAQVSELSSRKAARNKTIYKDHLYCSSVHLTFGMIFLKKTNKLHAFCAVIEQLVRYMTALSTMFGIWCWSGWVYQNFVCYIWKKGQKKE